jgi:carbon storage regulator
MLVISRNLGSSLFIGDKITVTILNITGNQVRIGIEAPKEISIVRDDAVHKQPKGNYHD